MAYLSIISVVLSGLGLGFGGFMLRFAKTVTLWGVRVYSTATRKKLYSAGGAVLALSLALFLLVALTYKVWVNMSFLYAVLCVCLWLLSLIIGGVWGDFVLAKHRGFSEISFLLLGEIAAVKTAERKLNRAYAAVIGFEGIAFLDKEGRASDVLSFEDFGLEELKRGIQTDILRQYFKSIEPKKEIHGLSNKLSEVLSIKAE